MFDMRYHRVALATNLIEKGVIVNDTNGRWMEITMWKNYENLDTEMNQLDQLFNLMLQILLIHAKLREF